MRKILAGFLATSMIVAVASSVTFAATAPSVKFNVAAVSVSPVVDMDGTQDHVNGAGKNTLDIYTRATAVEVSIGSSTFTVPISDAREYKKTAVVTLDAGTPKKAQFAVGGAVAGASVEALSKAEVKDSIVGLEFTSVEIDGRIYHGKFVADAGDTVKIELNGAKISADASSVTIRTETRYDKSNLRIEKAGTSEEVTINSITPSAGSASGTALSTEKGNGENVSEVDKSGDFFKTRDITDVIWCYGDGTPVPMTEKGVGADKDLNDQGGVQSGKTLYFMVRDDVVETFKDDTYWKIKVTKGDNGKLIKSVTDTTKIFSSPLVDANKGTAVSGIDFSKRHRYIKLEMNEIFTDDEYKCTLDLRLSPTSKAESKYEKQGVDGSEIKIKDFSFWVKNIVKPADNDWKVGIGGLMLNPIANDWNEVTYYDEDGDLAFMKFFGDSDTGKFYAKLSTKWEHADYASYFNDQDAYIFDFTGSPKISSTSRCDLQIYNPFVDEDGKETIDPATATIYQVIDGDLFDVTDNFTYEEGENGDMAFVTRTRFLGTYIICEKPVEEAADTEAPETDLVPEEAPSEVTPEGGSNDGGKAPANTGRYL